ncbi:MAG: cbb3-type cytochrome c oxidase subunit I [Verrucomicrobia bacterium]|nr:cbb3-type cytochrome c oxidase subunit I [Verrucomicrobiota bacterium]
MQSASADGSAVAPVPAPSTAQIDASCRWPVLYLFLKAIGWLVIGSVLGLIASLKFHAPGLLAECAWFTYGRVQPAALNALVYGFAAQAALGVALWMLCRLGRTTLAGGGMALIAVVCWNIGVCIGVAAILFGDSTGIEWLEMPRYASSLLFVAYLLLGICALLTFHQRRERKLYVSQWFLLAALFWFPWIYSTANFLLVLAPVRGVVQACVHWWYVNNLWTVWLGFLGLATLFYFIPKLSERPFHSEPLAIFSFWALALFGSWGGIHADAPVPAWIPSVSTFFTVLAVVPVVAVGLNLRQTLAGRSRGVPADPALRFVVFAAGAYVLAGVLAAVASHRSGNALLHFTLFDPARTQLALYGFLGMALFGAIYYIVPRLAPVELPSPKLINLHFWLAALGIAISFLSLGVGGVLQGLRLNDAGVPFPEVMKVMLTFFRFSTLGELLILAGNVALAANCFWLLARWGRACCVPVWTDWTAARPAAAEANA